VERHRLAIPRSTRERFRFRWRHGLVAIALGSGLVAAVPAASAAKPQRDVCRQQIESEVQRRFGQSVTRITYQFEHYLPGRDPKGLFHGNGALVYTGGCPGYHYFGIDASEHTCRSAAHYGRAPTYVRYRSSGDGC
jgi:hypothetical protein